MLLVPEAPPTQWVIGQSVREAYFPGLDEPATDESDVTGGDKPVDAYVQSIVVKSSGNLYKPLLGKLTRHPIPDLRLPPGEGRTLLDVGCNWDDGRSPRPTLAIAASALTRTFKR